MECERDLENGQPDDKQERCDERELDGGVAAIRRKPPHGRRAVGAGSGDHGVETEEIARLRTEVSWSSAMSQIAVTRPAVMTDTRTHPGTSPRSSPRAEALDRIRAYARVATEVMLVEIAVLNMPSPSCGFLRGLVWVLRV
jgi:hypothetical protein